jgi:small-conductance mechanosensitive channel
LVRGPLSIEISPELLKIPSSILGKTIEPIVPIRTPSVIFLPNLINCSLNNTVFSTTFDISYQADVDKAIELVNKELPNRLANRDEIIVMPRCNGVSSLSARSISLNVVATAKAESHYQLTRDIHKAIKSILEENNIKFPGEFHD